MSPISKVSHESAYYQCTTCLHVLSRSIRFLTLGSSTREYSFFLRFSRYLSLITCSEIACLSTWWRCLRSSLCALIHCPANKTLILGRARVLQLGARGCWDTWACNGCLQKQPPVLNTCESFRDACTQLGGNLLSRIGVCVNRPALNSSLYRPVEFATKTVARVQQPSLKSNLTWCIYNYILLLLIIIIYIYVPALSKFMLMPYHRQYTACTYRPCMRAQRELGLWWLSQIAPAAGNENMIRHDASWYILFHKKASDSMISRGVMTRCCEAFACFAAWSCRDSPAPGALFVISGRILCSASFW